MLREIEGIPPDLGGEGGIIKKTMRNKRFEKKLQWIRLQVWLNGIWFLCWRCFWVWQVCCKENSKVYCETKKSKTSIWTNILGNLTSRRNTTHLDVWILLALSPTQTHLDWCLNIFFMTSLFLKYQAILHSIPPYLTLRYLHINLPSNQVTILGLVAKRWKKKHPSGHSNLPLCSKSPHPELTSWSHRRRVGCLVDVILNIGW